MTTRHVTKKLLAWLIRIIFALSLPSPLVLANPLNPTPETADCQTFQVTRDTTITLSVHPDPNTPRVSGMLAHFAYPSRLCFTLTNAGTEDEYFALYQENPRMNHAELISEIDGVVFSAIIGTDYPLTLWSSQDAIFYIQIPAGKSTHHELLIGSDIPYNSSLQIQEKESLLRTLGFDKTLSGLLAGMIGILTLYFLFVAWCTKDKTFFYLSGSTASVTLMQLSDLGLLYSVWPNALHWNQTCSAFFAVLSTLFGACLARRYLDTPNTMPRTDKCLHAFSWYMLLVTLPLSLTNRQDLMMPLFALPALMFMLSLLAITITRIRQGFSPAKLYLAAYLLPLASGISIVLTAAGILPATTLSHLIPIAGTAVQMILFALALGERINWLNHERDTAYLTAIQNKTEFTTKRHFLAQISHELRTPLIGIMGLSDMLDRRNYTTADIDLIYGMESSAKHLLEMTNTLLDHARIDAGKWTTDSTTFSLHALVQNTLTSRNLIASKKQLTITAHIDENIPDNLQGDTSILQRILFELIDNAIHFTTHGGIVLMVEHDVSDTTPATVAAQRRVPVITLRFQVIDTGIGFNPEFNTRIFEMFELADDSSTRQKQGSGLGLSLCKKFCDLLGGTIGCESHPNAGSVFWFTVPLTVPLSAPSAIAISSAPDPISISPLREGSRILIAEDDAAIQLIVSSLMTRIGAIHHSVFDNGKLLLEDFYQQPEQVSLIILDWNMPVMNARETLAALRQFEALQHLPPTPVAIMTAHDAHSHLEKQMEAGIAILYKPVTVNALKQLLNMSQYETK